VTVGVLLMAYGSPASVDEIETYYTHIRRGRPPEAHQLADLRARYEAIGGVSTLRARTEAQARAIQAALDEAAPDTFRVQLGMKHTPPFIEDTTQALIAQGAETITAAVLAPHYSAGSVGEYLARAREAAAPSGTPVAAVEHWYDMPEFHEFLVAAVREARAALPPKTKVFFTAHSLPLRVLAGDPYAEQLGEGAAAVADSLGLAPFAEWAACWQSAGRTPEPWAGPDILAMIRALGETGRAEGVLVCPHGFVADHLEVAYDLDVDARRVADEVGLAFERTAVVNDDPSVMRALAARIAAVSGAPR
jgi:ferrochelatase